MAKKSTARAPAAAAAAVILPDGLAELMTAASHAALTVALANAELSKAEPGDEAAKAAFESANALSQESIKAIDAWFEAHVSARLASADEEAERQLAEKRAALKTQLEDLDAKSQDLTARRAEVEAALEALKNTPAATEENGGGGDAAIPAALPSIELAEGQELITVIGPAAGLRRAGHLFNAVPNTIVVSAEQKALIASDPALSITDDVSAEAEFASRQGEKPAATAFIFDPNGFTDVKVLGPKAGRRRAGHTFGPEATKIRVTRDDLAELLADELLAVGQA